MSDIGKWLEALELGQYVDAFEVNDVGLAVLAELDDGDLKELGISLGHRKLILKAIREGGVEPEGDRVSISPQTSREAERRQLTVMFCDLVGSTALSEAMDPEDLRALMAGYRKAAGEVVARFDGHVAQYLGDGLMVYFGWPRAHEDDGERAVRAALDMVEAVKRVDAPEPLRVRIGISTGPVVVGEGADDADANRLAVGETPNVAARLQGLAEPDQMVIAPGTYRLVGGAFDYEDLGEHTLKGILEPIRAWRVLGESRVEDRFEARTVGGLMPLVGRDEELRLLLRRWQQAVDGEGQVVLLTGEAGIGKSRITRALLDDLSRGQQFRIRYQCSPYHKDSALWPVIQQLIRAAGLIADEPVETGLDKLEQLADRAGRREDVPLIADLVGLDLASRHDHVDLPPHAKRARTLSALVEQLLGLAKIQPVFMILEDAHWIDPSTMELVERCLDRIAAARVFMLITSRPDQRLTFAERPNVTGLTLNRMDRAGVESIVKRLGGSSLPAETMDVIIDRTDGVPLFVEELTKAVLESAEASIPASLHDSLMARLDHVGQAKEVAQIAACIGREFDHELLAAVADRSSEEIAHALDRLAGAELIFRQGEDRYAFKHALVQDAAYESLLRSRRQTLQGRIADTLVTSLTDISESEPEIVAHHYTEAGVIDSALEYWRKAGERASARSANVEAITYLSRGLQALQDLPSGQPRDEQELSLQMAIAVPYLATKGYSASEVEQAYARAAEICQNLERGAVLFPIIRGLWNCRLVRGGGESSLELARQSVALADEQGDPVQMALSRRAIGTTLFYLGEFPEAAAQLTQGIKIDDGIDHTQDERSGFSVYAERAGVVCRTYLGWTHWNLGYPDQALETVKAGLELARRLGHAHSVAFAMVMVAVVLNCRRDYRSAVDWADKAIEMSSEYGLLQWLALGQIHRGIACLALNDASGGIDQIRAGVNAWQRLGAHLNETKWYGLIGVGHALSGESEMALSTLDHAIGLVKSSGETYYHTELLRHRAEIFVERGEQDAAEKMLLEALDVSRSQSAKSLELRAASSLAQLWREHGKRQEARDLLAPIYEWFTEGYDTTDLKDAKALLDELN